VNRLEESQFVSKNDRFMSRTWLSPLARLPFQKCGLKRNLLFSFAVTAVLQLGPVAVCRRILSVLSFLKHLF
jgi:hypothetical protein